ncbi:TetR/AcrR family transcriptional regulator [Actinomadura sp. WMMB 499]|uniref:TetR/AcrR family transcriptional regulator n=1 Tax=Actinomadura sp. WMMB 499 TaxID=1219491 RepID=UPI0012488C10|nr:TetR/AcrR family transcriptional regulator [Actinomadura sp. WMMB 499]QFG23639.1 TetR family transcriptional regulator [Actinomadura sp. WMMB 499]
MTTAPDGATGSRRTGRPPLTERRKAATRMRVAREAVRLFAAQGVAATSGREIANAAGISARTLWRYFPSKESCVAPLLTGGLEGAVRHLSAWPRDRPLAEAVDDPAWGGDADTEAVRSLVLLTRTEPGLRAVWLQVHQDAESAFARILAERTGRRETDFEVRVRAVALNGAFRVAVEEWVAGDGTVSRALLLRDALRLVDPILDG